MASLCAPPTAVSYAQRRLHDGQFPCTQVARPDRDVDAGLWLGTAVARQRLFRRFSSHGRRSGGNRGRRRRAGSCRAREIREPNNAVLTQARRLGACPLIPATHAGALSEPLTEINSAAATAGYSR